MGYKKTLYIVRGLPGSGKSTLAKQLAEVSIEADDYFMVDGKYMFDPEGIKEAHSYCFEEVEKAMYSRVDAVAVANTFTQKWEYKKYLKLAEDMGYSVFVIVCQNDFGNVHNVPQEVIERMRNRWED